MGQKKKTKTYQKPTLHARNKHQGRYDFKKLTDSYPDLGKFIEPNKYGDESISFFNPDAVKALNKALLLHQYNLSYWDIPKGYLCPPIPGRADYIHHVADLLRSSNYGNPLNSSKIKCLDIGTGANLIYPIIGSQEYGWSFIGSEIDKTSIESAENIISKNPSLEGKIEIRLQERAKDYLYRIINKDEIIDLTICNPPFHSSKEEANAGSVKKQSNLKGKKVSSPTLNFGGKSNELWCDGGEERFVRQMMKESKKFAQSCYWFTTLISKSSHLKNAYANLEDLGAQDVKTIPMGQGNKTSRILAWTFLNKEERKNWVKSRW